MLVKSLKLRNFGSFRDVFIEFLLKGVFLISGKTGSGKSTILEAICFALFKRTPKYGFDDSLPLKELPFKFSIDKNKLSYSLVELEFFINNDLYKVRREWKYDYKNNKIKEHLAEIYKNNEPIKVKVKDVEYEIIKILGFDDIKKAYNNFIKVVFLPQNQFDNFLISTPKERESILIDLFNLNLYYEIKEKISKEFTKLKNEIENLTNNIGFVKNNLLQSLDYFISNLEKLKNYFLAIEFNNDFINVLIKEIEFNDFNKIDNLNLDNLDNLVTFYNYLINFKGKLDFVLNKIENELEIVNKKITSIKALENIINNIFINFNVDNILNEVNFILEKIDDLNFDKYFDKFIDFKEENLNKYLELLITSRELVSKILNNLDSFISNLSKNLNHINNYLDNIYKIYFNSKEIFKLQEVNFRDFVFTINKFNSLKNEFEVSKNVNLFNQINRIIFFINNLELKVTEIIKKYHDFNELLINVDNLEKEKMEIKNNIDSFQKEYNQLFNNLQNLKTKKEQLQEFLELTAYVNTLRKYILSNKIDKCLVCKNEITDFKILENISLSNKEKEKISLEKEIKDKEKELERINISLSKLNGILKSKIEELNLVNKKVNKYYKDILDLVNIFIDILEDLKKQFLFLHDFINYLKANFEYEIMNNILGFDDKFVNEVILKILKIQQKIKLSFESVINENNSLYVNFFSKLREAFLNKIKFNVELISNLFTNYGLLDLNKYIDNIVFIFNEIKEDIQNIKNNILFLKKSNINTFLDYELEVNSFLNFLDDFLNYVNSFVQFRTEIDKNELNLRFNNFIKELKFLFEIFRKIVLNFDINIEKLKAILELKNKLNNIKEILNKKISELIKIKKDHDYLFDSSIYLISENFYSININKNNYKKNFETFKDININIDNFKNKISDELIKIENSLNTKKENLISFKQELNNYIKNFEIIFNNLNELKKNYNDLGKIKEEYELIEELYNDFFSRSKIDVISFLSKKLFDLLYFNTNNVIEKITEGRYNLFISEGMDIFIRDNWYSMDRVVKSLSGGEKFLTSLSLALSISEISSKSKYPIKSLFIDEGFSTLDVDTLNDVMEYLENYFNNISDKVLAIITHIPEVKDKFNYIIEIIKDKNGSKINIINKLLENNKIF